MNKTSKIFIISTIFIVIAILFIFINKSNNKDSLLINKNYVERNFEINLFEEDYEKGLKLIAEGRYIGQDNLIKEPVITLEIKCIYSYIDGKEKYTNQFLENIILKKENNMYTGEVSFDSSNKIDDHVCSYSILDANGSYTK